jgi:hypothetical protein
LGLVFAAHHQLASLERTSMAALEEGNAAKKIGARAAQSAAQAGASAQNASSVGFREIRNADRLSQPGADRVSLPGPVAAGIAMQLSGDPALQARFRRLQKETASAMNEASNQGKDLSTLRTPLPPVPGGRVLGR